MTAAEPAPSASRDDPSLERIGPRPLALRPSHLPFDYLDKVCLGGTSREHGASSAPVWQLHVRGRFDEGVARRAVRALALRYPVLASRVVSLEPGRAVDRAHRLAYALDPEPDVERIFTGVDLRAAGADGVERFRQQAFNHHLDLEVDYPVRFTFARTADDAGVLFLQQHHAIADGSAFFDLIADLAALYDAALDDALPAEIAPVLKVPEQDLVEPRFWRRLRWRAAGVLLHAREIARLALAPPSALSSNVSRDFSGDNRVEHLLLGDEVLERCRAARARVGLSANDLLSGAMAAALARWTVEDGREVRRFNLLLPADVRPRGRKIASFANHLSSYLVHLDYRRDHDPLALAASIRRQVRRQADGSVPAKKVLAEIWLSRHVAVRTIRRAVFGARRATLNFPFSNLIPISPPSGGFRTRAWEGESLRIMTPCVFLQGANTTVIRYRGQLCFNFNHKASAVPTPRVRRLIEIFRLALDEALDAAGRSG